MSLYKHRITSPVSFLHIVHLLIVVSSLYIHDEDSAFTHSSSNRIEEHKLEHLLGGINDSENIEHIVREQKEGKR